VFLASSVVQSLKENQTLSINGLELVACPVESCITKPEECSKGQKESCEKKIDIVYQHDGHNKVVVLIFHYQLRGHSREGFIRKNDLSLNILIKREIINTKNLIEN
jgi:hypothetical protein